MKKKIICYSCGKIYNRIDNFVEITKEIYYCEECFFLLLGGTVGKIFDRANWLKNKKEREDETEGIYELD